jgi:hypothetical protein
MPLSPFWRGRGARETITDAQRAAWNAAHGEARHFLDIGLEARRWAKAWGVPA